MGIKKLPHIYQKLLKMIQEKEASNLSQREFREDIPRRFRISTEDIPKILNEFKEAGLIKSKTQRRLRFK